MAGIPFTNHIDGTPHEFASESAAATGEAGQHPADGRLLEACTRRQDTGICDDRTVTRPADQVERDVVETVEILVRAILLDDEHCHASGQHCIQLPSIELVEFMKTPLQ